MSLSIRSIIRNIGSGDSVPRPERTSGSNAEVRIAYVYGAACNTRAFQRCAGWLRPWWMQKEFDATSGSFVPRAAGIDFHNLTHRNWTAIGVPECPAIPVVDPRGMLTPFHNGWSIDLFFVDDAGEVVAPCTARDAEQQQRMEGHSLSVQTRISENGIRIESDATVLAHRDRPVCRLRSALRANRSGWLVVSLRPFNPEGIAPLERIALSANRTAWAPNGVPCVYFSRPVERHLTSHASDGDVMSRILERGEQSQITCREGLATAAALYRVEAGEERQIEVRIALSKDPASRKHDSIFPIAENTWELALREAPELELGDERTNRLYQAALRSLVIHSPGEIYGGPLTSKEFRFCDAAVIMDAMLCAGMMDRVERVLDGFQAMQDSKGCFRSPDGDIASTGIALWLFWRYHQMSGRALPHHWSTPVIRGAHWIASQRKPGGPAETNGGLIGGEENSDHSYRDNFWSEAGLRAAARLCQSWRVPEELSFFLEEAEALRNTIQRSLQGANGAIAASPHGVMDSNAVHSLVACHPLQLLRPDESPFAATVEFLQHNCLISGLFFDQTGQSGLRPEQSLQIAQVLLQQGDASFYSIVRRAAEAATPTGQWPEALHPRTLAGCGGDGQHVPASAEWLMMVRNMFVREEGNALILGSGLVEELRRGPLKFGPAPTAWGPVTVSLEDGAVSWNAEWRGAAPEVVVALPGLERRNCGGEAAGRVRCSGGNPAVITQG
jgi:hypothetical protein